MRAETLPRLVLAARRDRRIEQKLEKLARATVRWHGRLEVEAPLLMLGESQLALATLASLCTGEHEAVDVLRRLLRRVWPMHVLRVPP